ncbi:hypothetical protein MJO29_008775 [Puccinia striiformis f. sp. tritici]|nr:hypothetical protein Pst134EB_016177 [Puccinia striiformis f. sp. tritici]KAI7953144.1 hypothetical protein MJO29_008775 [Puccinia striiformis f. sp. tritici]
MHLPSALTLTTLFVSFAMNARAVWPPPNDYIMSDHIDWTNHYLSVYFANGKDAFRWAQQVDFPRPGMTTSTLKDDTSKVLFDVVSSNDFCHTNSIYSDFADPKDPLPRREFSLQLRTHRADVWRFNFIDGSGNRQYYKFNKNSSNKGGRIYKVASGQRDRLDALLRSQTRNDPWWNNPKGVKTFTLSVIDDAPVREMVMLMGLILIKSNDCRGHQKRDSIVPLT